MNATHETAASSAVLWIVATPIGSLGDLGPRAVEILGSVDMILVEDTRRTGRLLAAAGIPGKGRMRSFHEHNEDRESPAVLELLTSGRQVALVSDAGTPALSDPGFGLVRSARELGIEVLSVPGPSAFTTALAAAGQPPLPATLIGFLPPRSGPRQRRIEELAGVPWTLVLFLSPHRLAGELTALAEGLGSERPATLLAELSKRNERAVMATLGELVGADDVARPRGEYVIVIGPIPEIDEDPHEKVLDPVHLREVYDRAVAAGASRREALRTVTAECGASRRRVYELLFVDRE